MDRVLDVAVDGVRGHVAGVELLEYLGEDEVQNVPVLATLVFLNLRVEDVSQHQLVARLDLGVQVVHVLVQVNPKVLLVREVVLGEFSLSGGASLCVCVVCLGRVDSGQGEGQRGRAASNQLLHISFECDL